MNKLVIIGYTGIRTAYLNISEEEAIKKEHIKDCEMVATYCRYSLEEYTKQLYNDNLVEIEEFDDSFHMY